jgi:hypothetical protein
MLLIHCSDKNFAGDDHFVTAIAIATKNKATYVNSQCRTFINLLTTRKSQTIIAQ